MKETSMYIKTVWIVAVLLMSNMAAAYTAKHYHNRNKITTLCQMGKSIWIGTQSGLIVHNKKHKTYKLADHPVLNNLSITDLEPYWAKKTIYVAGSPKGVLSYVPASNKLSPVSKGLKKQKVWRMDRLKSMLAVCYGEAATGLDMVNLKTTKVKSVIGLDSIKIFNTAWDDNILWALGQHVIYRYNSRNKKLQAFSPNNTKYQFLNSHYFTDYSEIQVGDDYVAFLGSNGYHQRPILYSKSDNSLSENNVIKDADAFEVGMLFIPLRRKGELYWIRSSYDVYAPSNYATYYIFDVADRQDLLRFGGTGFHTCTLKDDRIIWLGTSEGLLRFDFERMKLSFNAFEPDYQNLHTAYAANKDNLFLAAVKPVDPQQNNNSHEPKFLHKKFNPSTGHIKLQSNVAETTPGGWRKIQMFAKSAGIHYPTISEFKPPRFTYPEDKRYMGEDEYDDYHAISRLLHYPNDIAFSFFEDNLYIGAMTYSEEHHYSTTNYFSYNTNSYDC